jgi:hypothetical protein
MTRQEFSSLAKVHSLQQLTSHVNDKINDQTAKWRMQRQATAFIKMI